MSLRKHLNMRIDECTDDLHKTLVRIGNVIFYITNFEGSIRYVSIIYSEIESWLFQMT